MPLTPTKLTLNEAGRLAESSRGFTRTLDAATGPTGEFPVRSGAAKEGVDRMVSFSAS